MKGHLAGFGVSALLHGTLLLVALPLLLWQDKLSVPEEQPLTLSLAQFQPAPPPPQLAPPEPIAPPPVAQPVPPSKPESKPVVKPKPVEKPKPPEKPKPAPKPEKPRKRPEPKPEVVSQPAPVKEIVPPAPVVAPRPAPVLAPAPRPVQRVAASATPVENNAALEAAYRQKLQSLIAARKQYPRMAEKAEVEGTVTVSFTVLPNGTITGARVSQSSGNEWLDKAAVQAVIATSGALPFPAGIHKARWDFALKVNFKLDW
ncbi:energy transducer TonB [Thiothrix subterranea]|uniref:Protein TonB n=1 Tax=Thiothrix subterranea TaxID=2735563 RepID=A0AA51MPT1_9GAMM|nr:energy transducer TonB [Thiothrix subterranea]MDQ5767070.1 energy transducer TonB [Thiothrix subterranea]WML88068.1 energy transducer TonB [Thiothrix subterranea]